MPPTTFLLAIVIAALAGPRAAGAQEVRTNYFLPKSIVTLAATVTTKNTFPDDPGRDMAPRGHVETNGVTVSLSNVPDPGWPLVLLSEPALLSKNTVSVEVSPTGLLTAVNARSEGLLGSIVKNVFGAIVSLSKAAAGLRMSTATDAEKKYERDERARSARRSELREQIARATTLIIELEKRLIAAEKAEERRGLRSRIDDVQRAVTDLRSELLLGDAHFSAWKARMEDAREERIEHIENVDDLPDDGPVQRLAANGDDSIGIEEVKRAACTRDGVEIKNCAFGSVVERSRVIVTQASAAREPDVKPATEPGKSSTTIFFRGLRPAQLSVYMLNASNKPVLTKRTFELVMGRRSAILSLPVYNSKWSTKSLGAIFTNGALTKVTTETGSEIAGAAEALRGIPAEYLAAVKQANEIISEDSKLRLAGVQAQIDELKKRKELIEAQVAGGESGDLVAMQAETARLDAELRLLTSQRAITAAQGPASADAAISLQMLKLQNDLAEAQVKQLQLQQQLEEVRKKLGGQQ